MCKPRAIGPGKICCFSSVPVLRSTTVLSLPSHLLSKFQLTAIFLYMTPYYSVTTVIHDTQRVLRYNPQLIRCAALYWLLYIITFFSFTCTDHLLYLNVLCFLVLCLVPKIKKTVQKFNVRHSTTYIINTWLITRVNNQYVDLFTNKINLQHISLKHLELYYMSANISYTDVITDLKFLINHDGSFTLKWNFICRTIICLDGCKIAFFLK